MQPLFGVLLIAAGLLLAERVLRGAPRLLESLGDRGFEPLLGHAAARHVELCLCALLVATGLVVACGLLDPTVL